MLSQYIQAALRKAKYEILEDNEGFFGTIPGFQGVWANAATREECERELAEVLEGWIELHLADNTSLPIIDGLNLNAQKVA